MKIVQKKRGTEKKKFWRVWQSYEDILFKKCLRYTLNYHNAQDLLSDVMLKASEKFNKKLLKENPCGWLVKILKNTYIDQYRRSCKRQISIMYTDNEEGLDSKSDLTFSTPLDDIFEEELQKCIERSLQKMPPRRRHLTLLLISGYTYQYISKSYGINLEAVRQMMLLSRNEIRQEINLYQSDKDVDYAVESTYFQSKELYSHLLKYTQEDGYVHYHFLVNSLPSNRLQQKEATMCKYISLCRKPNDTKLKLAFNLSSQGRFDDVLVILKELIDDCFYSEELFELQIKLLFILDRKQEVFKAIDKAIKSLSSVHSKFYALWMLSQNNYRYAEKFLLDNIGKGYSDLDLRLLLVEVYELQNKTVEAYEEGEKIYTYSKYNPDIYLYHLKNKLLFDGYKEAHELAESQYTHDTMSGLNCIYYLHFLVNDNCLGTDKKLLALFNKVRKRFFWHPDFALVKAFLSPERTAKFLHRRCADYPNCALSRHYLALLTGFNDDVPKLSFQEKVHLSIVKMIYNL